ncbi:hypothetical protein B0H17DRAFT_1144273 [Mycena rosella]|uniref:Uncharacterized protein n=1 Tax=Mycena rosella TaxID=1033263 RepID=A0AAD7G3K5_MYCRO|nr:hypothetical protein B0H17DRAFT_1144273 [Mycena rosella]
MSAPNLDTSRAFQITRISDSVAAEKYTIRANEHLLLDEAGDVKLDKIVAEKTRTHSLDAVLKKRLPGACFDLSGGPPTTGKGTSAPTAYVDKDDFYQHRGAIEDDDLIDPVAPLLAPRTQKSTSTGGKFLNGVLFIGGRAATQSHEPLVLVWVGCSSQEIEISARHDAQTQGLIQRFPETGPCVHISPRARARRARKTIADAGNSEQISTLVPSSIRRGADLVHISRCVNFKGQKNKAKAKANKEAFRDAGKNSGLAKE